MQKKLLSPAFSVEPDISMRHLNMKDEWKYQS